MPYTLIEMAKGASPEAKPFIEEYARSSDILLNLPFKEVLGNAYAYTREYTLPGVGFRGYNEGFDSSIGVINPQSESMKMAGGDLDVDAAIIATMGESERAKRELMQVKSHALAWTRTFIKGDTVSDPKSFDGLQNRLTGSQLVDVAPAGGALSMIKLLEARDLVDDPTHWVMNKTMRRLITQAGFNTSVGGYITHQEDAFGRPQTMFADLPILIADEDNADAQILPFTEFSADGSSSNNCSIYCVSLMPGKVEGLNFRNIEGGFGISVRDMGELESKPVYRTRVDWHTGLAVQHGRSAARLRGIKALAMTL